METDFSIKIIRDQWILNSRIQKFHLTVRGWYCDIIAMCRKLHIKSKCRRISRTGNEIVRGNYRDLHGTFANERISDFVEIATKKLRKNSDVQDFGMPTS